VVRLAVSNIAWHPEEEEQVANLLEALNVRHVEVAPTKIFADPLNVSKQEHSSYRRFWADHDIDVVAFQSMLFGRPELQVFGDRALRTETARVLGRFIELAGTLGVECLVFGSPRNRVVPPGMSGAEAQDIAVDFFAGLALVAAQNSTVFCIEPNPTAYDCNFVTTAAAGLELVRAVDHPGFGLHLDAAGMTLADDSLGDSIRAAGNTLQHFHASGPFLGPLETDFVAHAEAAEALRDTNYAGYISIEMRPGAVGAAAQQVRSAVELATALYGQDSLNADRGEQVVEDPR
jgi:D-psicose/D-tagatose/L-ribulose 3-epimerase